jgi:hypothetical protein
MTITQGIAKINYDFHDNSFHFYEDLDADIYVNYLLIKSHLREQDHYVDQPVNKLQIQSQKFPPMATLFAHF